MTIVDSVKALLLRRLLVKSSLVIYVSRWMRQVVEKELLFKNSCSMIIPNSVDTNLFKPPREKIGFHGVSIRGLSWKYGVDIAILAYSNLPTQKLTIIGTGPLEHKLRNLACITNSNVDILAQSIDHDELPNFMSKFSYFVSPSRTEAQGVTMCEAMAMGIPPIATTVGGIPEFVVNEENGLLIPPENPLLLRKAVLRLANDEELFERLSQNAISFVHNRLSLDVIGKKEIQVFKFLTNSF